MRMTDWDEETGAAAVSVAAVATLVVTTSMYSVSRGGGGLLLTFSVRQQEWGGKANLDGPSIPTARDETCDRSELVMW